MFNYQKQKPKLVSDSHACKHFRGILTHRSLLKAIPKNFASNNHNYSMSKDCIV